MTDEEPPIVERGLLAMSDSEWDEAVRQAAVIAPLAASDVVGRGAVNDAATLLGVSHRQVYVLIDRYRRGTGRVTDLLPGRSGGGRGGGRLTPPVEAVIDGLIRKRYLKRQKLSLAVVHRDIVRACTEEGLPAPSRSTVARRVAELHPTTVARRREGADAARPLPSAGGIVPEISAPLEQVQIDHTVIDLVIVDERDRQPVGRPYLTAAIDVYSRCLVGMVVTLEPPSAVSVGLCLAHVCSDKRPWLEGLGIGGDWPMSGKPRLLYLDNASEFKSEALRRGCEQHGIQLDYRPLGRPHYGGIVERVIGTVMAQIHELPGTTFSNPVERRTYDSEKTAALTLNELERWLALAVVSYHGSIHSGLAQTPAARWDQGITESGKPPVVTSPTAFLVDFLPVLRRKLGRTGFVIDHVHYFANVLKPWIARRDRLERFVIRRDPRDISRIWVLDPEGNNYVEVPYRTLSNPAVTLWEHRQAVARLREQGRAQVNEQELFRMIGQMREIASTAQRDTRRSRRDRERRSQLKSGHNLNVLKPPRDGMAGDSPPAAPFDDIEEW
ncbi:Mu transposase C-terminal domain-containing protein [Arthrobacter sp. U41]|uniref:Mu transposase C-terminal domain-containing protein n=1 Tax=Arthrobacter sp. U41 TaxID=1849032 RepID=UPI0008592CDA|nr:Mu transposase C-terminal domain-containing protein [Arthrobacter sp. U41]AOT03646.1 transposase [Arthrobacter sp. U41]